MSQEKKKRKKQKSDVLRRLAQASVQGLVMEVVLNSVLPGAGVMMNGVNQGKNIKNVAKVMGKSAAEEGVNIIDGNGEEEQNPTEDLTEKIGLKVLGHVRGRG